VLVVFRHGSCVDVPFRCVDTALSVSNVNANIGSDLIGILARCTACRGRCAAPAM